MKPSVLRSGGNRILAPKPVTRAQTIVTIKSVANNDKQPPSESLCNPNLAVCCVGSVQIGEFKSPLLLAPVQSCVPGSGKIGLFIRNPVPTAQTNIGTNAVTKDVVSNEDRQPPSAPVVLDPDIKTVKKAFCCPICPRTYVLAQSMLELHLTFHKKGSRNLTCPVCGKFKNAWTCVLKHYHQSHSEIKENASLYELVLATCDRNRLCCSQCDTRFETRRDLIHHLQKSHIGEKVKGSEEDEDIEESRLVTSDTSVSKVKSLLSPGGKNGETGFVSAPKRINQYTSEQIRNKNFVSALKRKLQASLEKDKTVFFPIAGPNYVPAIGREIEIGSLEKDKTVFYPIAGPNFIPAIGQEIEIGSHIENHKCTNCSYSTDTEYNLVLHSQECKSKKNNFGDAYQKFLQDHTQEARSRLFDDSPDSSSKSSNKYPCDYCSQKFPSKCKLSNHLRTHKEDTMFHCKACKYMCLNQKTMQRHIYRAHPRLNTRAVIIPPKVQRTVPSINSKLKKKRDQHYYSESEDSVDSSDDEAVQATSNQDKSI